MSNLDSVIQDPDRIAAVRGLGVLDSAVHEPLDTLARLAASAVSAPVSSISLLDGEDQYFVATHGVPSGGVARPHAPVGRSICRLTVGGGETLSIPDLREDLRAPETIHLAGREVVAYLGVPVRLAGGEVVGSLCVVDDRPREWSDADATVLGEIARSIVSFFALRKRVLDGGLTDADSGIPGETLFLARCTAIRRAAGDRRSAMYRIEPPAGSDPRHAARRLVAAVGATDVIGRMHDGAFVVFAHELRDERDALALAGRLRRALGDSSGSAAGTRIGIALGDIAGESVAELVRRADHVMRGPVRDGSSIRLAA